MLQTLENWDESLLIFLNGLGSEITDGFWLFVTTIENWIWLYILFVVLLLKYYKIKRGVILVLFTIFSFTITYALKFFVKASVQRVRPNNEEGLSELIRVLQFPTDYSFFSGHASVSFAVTVFVFLTLRKHLKWTYLFFIWPILFSFSRIYVGVHYPSDILIGALVGIGMGVLLYKTFTYFFIYKKSPDKSELF